MTQILQKMETGGRSFSEIYRNTSEEIFLKTLMEGTVGMPAPTMEMIGFKNVIQNCRTDSEELFKNWLTTAENGYNSTGIPRHPRQASRRLSRELASLTGQHLPSPLQRKRSNETLFAQPTPVLEEPTNDPNDPNQNSASNGTERGLQASNLYLAKAWFQSSQPMTRSRSSELRRRYVAMQNTQTPNGMHPLSIMSGQNVDNTKQEITNQNVFGDISMCDIQNQNQFNTFMSPSNSSSSPFNNPPIDNVDKVSSVVNMLKDTLERKKTYNQGEVGIYGAQEIFGDTSLNQGQGSHIHETFGTYQDVPQIQVDDPSFMQALQGSYNVNMDHFVTPMNLRAFSREPSISESSAVATVGFDVCDGPSNSGQAMSDNSRRRAENGSKDTGNRIAANVKEQKKKPLVRYGSVTSTGSVEKGDPTKKRRVERSRKMAEAKERNLTPPIPSDMQSILKRCENLEKEVRSLKLNLSFMNRKDSEQTKQIEELQKQNDELSDEKERLLEEIERILGDGDK